jgi:hypothetical protein
MLCSNCAEGSCTRGDTIGHELTSSPQTAEMKQILESARRIAFRGLTSSIAFLGDATLELLPLAMR